MTTTFRLREVLEKMEKPPTLTDLAEQSGVSRTTVHGIHANKTTRVDLATLDALAKALGCEPGELIERRAVKRGRE